MSEPRFRFFEWILWIVIVLFVVMLCVSLGSVQIPLAEVAENLGNMLSGNPAQGAFANIIRNVRLPRVLCAALTGAALSLCGAAMQGLLQNPLADGSTLGVSAGASLGAALSIFLGFTLSGSFISGTVRLSILFAFVSLAAILLLALSLDRSLSTATIILIGVVYSMLVSSLLSLLIAFSGNKLRAISFWTMGSLASSSYENVLLLLITLVIAGGILLSRAKALNAFALGEDRALHLGVDIRREKLIVMSCVSILIGVSVSIGGGIAFVGLITPHIMRMLSGPNHKRLLPCCLFGGAVFLMFCDLIARTIVSPIELPIGVVTSLIGAVMFIVIFIRQRSRRIV